MNFQLFHLRQKQQLVICNCNVVIDCHRINETATRQISDVSGRKLKEEKMILTGSTSYAVDIKDLPKGKYYLLLNTSSKMG